MGWHELAGKGRMAPHETSEKKKEKKEEALTSSL